MLRTSSLSYPVTFFSNLRLPVLSSFRSPFPSFPPKLVSTPISAPQTPPFCQRTPSSMVGSNPRPQGKVMFSSGRSDGGNKEILVQHLLVGQDDVKMLTELQKRISEGVDLSDLAVEYSICPSKENGGMLGWVRKGQMVPEFEEAAFSAPLNKVVRCKTKFGWHLLQVLSEREESKLEDIAPEELHSKMQDPIFIEEAQLIDVREPEEVAQASLPGFKVLPLRQFGTWGSVISDEFDPEKDTYVLGFKKVFNVAGGIHAYSVNVDPSVPTY
ncbi:rhodanese-like/PpiC domain-containing protein 12, chloroplastic isoform X2 [Asparagus officinalis]|uniref:rhodanese-like/PpiC domain-containing protein 12, chloroplastic isoform X2 n=1 Tax=Asparagus officinalis TaxID=4686 RepID=UPI00098DE3EF|nr:rhodanese-like/PpiC domain-containing protein 12, chloroplastic isoform X2 [Asparagus officinalis]